MQTSKSTLFGRRALTAEDRKPSDPDTSSSIKEAMKELFNHVQCSNPQHCLAMECKGLSSGAARILAEKLKTYDLTHMLFLAYSGITDDDAFILADALNVNNTLQLLTLESNYITDPSAIALASTLCQNSSLQALSLEHNAIRDAGAIEFAACLCQNSSLQMLSLACNSITDQGLCALAAALTKNEGLNMLYIGHNCYSNLGIKCLAEALPFNNSLSTLSVACSCISDEGAGALASALKFNKGIRKLDLSSNYITDVGAMALAEAIESHEGMHTLTLSCNFIGDAGASAIAKALNKGGWLRRLHLGSNMVTDTGAIALADSLMKKATLMEIHLERNSIGNDGAMALATMLTCNLTLQLLSLESNCISDAGAEALAGALTGNFTLRKLSLAHNYISDVGAHKLANGVAKSNLAQLSLECNPLTEFGAGVIVSMAKRFAVVDKLVLHPLKDPQHDKLSLAWREALQDNNPILAHALRLHYPLFLSQTLMEHMKFMAQQQGNLPRAKVFQRLEAGIQSRMDFIMKVIPFVCSHLRQLDDTQAAGGLNGVGSMPVYLPNLWMLDQQLRRTELEEYQRLKGQNWNYAAKCRNDQVQLHKEIYAHLADEGVFAPVSPSGSLASSFSSPFTSPVLSPCHGSPLSPPLIDATLHSEEEQEETTTCHRVVEKEYAEKKLMNCMTEVERTQCQKGCKVVHLRTRWMNTLTSCCLCFAVLSISLQFMAASYVH